MAAQDGVLRVPLLLGIELLEEVRFAGGEHRDGNAIAIQNAIARERGHACAGREHADEIERIGGRDSHLLTGVGLAANVTQQPDGLRRRELLAGESGDEAPATNLAARLEAAAAHQQIAPRRQPARFARGEAPEDHAPATQQRAHDVLDGFIVGSLRCSRAAQSRSDCH